MNNFWTLVALEYKKFLIKKSIIIAIIVTFMVSLMVSGIGILINEVVDENGDYINAYEDYKADKIIISELNGREFNKELILEASKGYDENPIMYGEVYRILKNAKSDFTINDFKNMSEEEASMFYDYRKKVIEDTLISSDTWNEKQTEYVLSINESVNEPFVFQYANGYKSFLGVTLMVIILIAFFLISFIISPVFSYEYNKNMDSLILTTKNGKKSVIYAKIFVTFTIGAFLTLALMCFSLLVTLGIYGFDGGLGQIQLYVNFSVYDFTFIQVVALLFVTATIGGIFHASLCMVVSAFTEKSIIPMTVSIIAIAMSGSFSGVPILEKVLMFLPQSISRFDYVIQPVVFNFFGMSFMFYQALFIIVIPIIILFGVITFNRFKNYQG